MSSTKSDPDSETIFTPIAPRAGGYYKQDPSPKLSESEEGMYNEVLAHFAKDGYLIPDEEKGELLEKEKFWLSRECLLRYLRASKWVVATAIHRIEDTLRWRREYGLNDKITAKHVEPEAVTGKEILFGFDTCGRPASYMIPSRQNTTDPALQNEYAVWMMERSIDLMEPGVETVSLLINFAQRARHPNINQARAFLNILQNHYPERLGTALLLNIPFLVSAFMRIIMPFVDPVTRHKVKMNPQVVKDGLYEEDMLMREWWGGNREFEYVHEKYWPALVSSTEERVQGWMRRWRELGGGVGVREWEYKGGLGAEVEDEKKDEVAVAVAAVAPVLPPVDVAPVAKALGLAESADLLVDKNSAGGGAAVSGGGVSVGAVSAGAVATSGGEGGGGGGGAAAAASGGDGGGGGGE